jgi:hypothetical protein
MQRMHITDDTMQRLVDGELTTVEYQDAILALEADPTTSDSNAWRRCALTFLESQAFELGAKSWLDARKRGEDIAERDLVAPTHPESVIAKRTIPAWMTFLTVAASIAGAFWVGGLMRDLTLPPLPRGEAANVAVTSQPTFPATYEQTSSEGSIFVSMPAMESEDESFDREAWLAGAPTPLSPEMQRHWERVGFTLRTGKRLFRKTLLPDGRTIDAPIEQYELVPNNAEPQ